MTFKVLIFGAHPDDVESAFGGTVAKLTQKGHEVALAVPTLSAESCSDVSLALVPQGDLLRMEEARNSASFLGAKFLEISGNYHSPLNFGEQVFPLVDLLRIYRPTVVFGNCSVDAHPTHRRLAALLEQAIFYAASPYFVTESEPHAISVCGQYCAYSCSGTCSPSYFVEVSEQIGIADHALALHVEGLRLVPGLRAWARARRLSCGAKYGVPYAECFTAVRSGMFGFKPNVRTLETLWHSLEGENVR